MLVELVELARRGDFEALCSYADGNCPHVLTEAGPDRVPADPPAIVGTWTLDPTPSRYGGVVLQVCGVDATGAPYASEILFMRTVGGIRVVQPVYWSGLRIARDGTAGGTPAPGFAGCP